MASFGAGVIGTRDIFDGDRLAVGDTTSRGHFLCVGRSSEMERKRVPGTHPSMPMHTIRCASWRGVTSRYISFCAVWRRAPYKCAVTVMSTCSWHVTHTCVNENNLLVVTSLSMLRLLTCFDLAEIFNKLWQHIQNRLNLCFCFFGEKCTKNHTPATEAQVRPIFNVLSEFIKDPSKIKSGQ